MVYLSAIGFALAVFPVHIFNYVFIDTKKKFAGINVCAYRIFAFYNANTIEGKPGEMQVNGKNKKADPKNIRKSAYKIFNSLCLYKIVQLGDYGVKESKNAHLALAQSALTTAIYKFIQVNGHYCKLRNYAVLNAEHGYVRYYLKAVTIINSIVVGKILLILLLEKLNAYKD